MALGAMNLDDGSDCMGDSSDRQLENGGTLATAGGLVFYGQASGEFAAVDAATGVHLWHFETQEIWKSSPITYMVNGKQYIATASWVRIFSPLLCRNRVSTQRVTTAAGASDLLFFCYKNTSVST